MARRAPRPLSLAIGSVVESAQPQTPLAAVQRVWEGAVGEAIARESSPVSERDGTVTIACSSAVWAAELDLMRPDIEARLAEHLDGAEPVRLKFVTK